LKPVSESPSKRNRSQSCQRERLGAALHDACVETLGLDPLRFTIEFTQHAGDELFGKIFVDGVLRGGLALDWTPDEVVTPLMDTPEVAARGAG
jgi:hypothetical protein